MRSDRLLKLRSCASIGKPKKICLLARDCILYYEAGNNCLKKFPANNICWYCFYVCFCFVRNYIQPIFWGFVTRAHVSTLAIDTPTQMCSYLYSDLAPRLSKSCINLHICFSLAASCRFIIKKEI